MKVVQINGIYKFKSTGRTCWETEKYLEAHGHESLTLHQTGDCSDPKHSYVINSKAGYYLHKLLSRITGLDGYFSYFATKRALRAVDRFDPDIIHLRNLHGGYIHLPTLFRYLAQKDVPVVFNLHDTWAYTGKCPEYVNCGCGKWREECRHCPQLKQYPKSWFFDRTRKIFRDKRRWYASIKRLIVVGVSDYISEEAKKSPLFQDRRVERIYNWIDLDKLRPRGDPYRREFLPEDKFVVAGVSSHWGKNTEYREICELAGLLGDEAQVYLIGGRDLALPHANMRHIPFTNSIEELACIYSEADAFVCLSTAESFGKVAAEALACGTPAVVYDTTGIAEIPAEGCGYVVGTHDVAGVRDRLLEIKSAGKAAYSDRCRERAQALFNYETNAGQLLRLYDALLRKGS